MVKYLIKKQKIEVKPLTKTRMGWYLNDKLIYATSGVTNTFKNQKEFFKNCVQETINDCNKFDDRTAGFLNNIIKENLIKVKIKKPKLSKRDEIFLKLSKRGFKKDEIQYCINQGNFANDKDWSVAESVDFCITNIPKVDIKTGKIKKICNNSQCERHIKDDEKCITITNTNYNDVIYYCNEKCFEEQEGETFEYAQWKNRP